MPAARSRPTSRARSATVIDSVLKMRNAPPKRATAATSAIVGPRSRPWPLPARRRGRRAWLSVYGSTVSRCSSSAVTPAVSAPSATRTSTAVTRSVAKRCCAASRATTTDRRAGSGRPGSRARTPTTRKTAGRDGRIPEQRDRGADAEPVLAGQLGGDERPVIVAGAQRRARRQGAVVDGGIGRPVDADHGDRRRQRCGCPAGEGVGPALEARCDRRDARGRGHGRHALGREALLLERGDAHVGPTRRCRRRSGPRRRRGRR